MKVYSAPEGINAPAWPSPFSNEAYNRNNNAYIESIRKWLLSNGYTGKHTGEIVRFPVADGYAQYMIAEGRSSHLIHLEIGDAYDYGDVRFLPKREILKRLEQQKRMAKLFGHKE